MGREHYDGYYKFVCPIHGVFLYDKECTSIDEVCCMVPHTNLDPFNEFGELQ